MLTSAISNVLLLTVGECGHTSVSNVMDKINDVLLPSEVKEVEAFLKWAFFDWDKRGFGHGNIEARWNKCFSKSKKIPRIPVQPSSFGKAYSRKDRKPFTLRELTALITKLQADPKMTAEILDKPVTMSSDEEGNEMLQLAFLEVSKSGEVLLYPAHFY